MPAKSHGHSRSANPLAVQCYHAWRNMKYRCAKPSCKDYPRYGGRGIAYHYTWELYENFLEDMGLPTAPNLTLEREDNDGNYEPGNCKWATREEQAQNKTFSANKSRAAVDQVKALRAQGVSIRKVAKIVGMAPSSIWIIMSGKYDE